jgi:hypothetical protein
LTDACHGAIRREDASAAEREPEHRWRCACTRPSEEFLGPATVSQVANPIFPQDLDLDLDQDQNLPAQEATQSPEADEETQSQKEAGWERWEAQFRGPNEPPARVTRRARPVVDPSVESALIRASNHQADQFRAMVRENIQLHERLASLTMGNTALEAEAGELRAKVGELQAELVEVYDTLSRRGWHMMLLRERNKHLEKRFAGFSASEPTLPR